MNQQGRKRIKKCHKQQELIRIVHSWAMEEMAARAKALFKSKALKVVVDQNLRRNRTDWQVLSLPDAAVDLTHTAKDLLSETRTKVAQ